MGDSLANGEMSGCSKSSMTTPCSSLNTSLVIILSKVFWFVCDVAPTLRSNSRLSYAIAVSPEGPSCLSRRHCSSVTDFIAHSVVDSNMHVLLCAIASWTTNGTFLASMKKPKTVCIILQCVVTLCNSRKNLAYFLAAHNGWILQMS